MDAGISIDTIDGIVAEFEAREAAIYCNYNWLQWVELEPWERAESIAQYRMHFTVEAHVQDAANEEAERQARQSRT